MELFREGIEGLKSLGSTAQLEARRAVSGSKYRYQFGDCELDLCYVTNSIIAMGFPAIGADKFYRNNAEDVAHLLNTQHRNCWRIFNVSEVDYSYPCFPGENVKFFGWLDHHAPTMERLVDTVLSMDEWMSRDPSHVLAVHCMAGKSRTGTVIACYMLYKGLFSEPDQSIAYFNQQRGRDPCLELPSQIRYVNMFYNLLKFSQTNRCPSGLPINMFPLQQPIYVSLAQISVSPVPSAGVQGSGWSPYIEIHDGRGLFPNPPPPRYGTLQLPKFYCTQSGVVINPNIVIQGDIMIKFYHQSSIGKILLFRLQFHTSLRLGTDQNNFLEYIEFTKNKLDTALNCSDVELKVGGVRGVPDDVTVRLSFGKVILERCK